MKIMETMELKLTVEETNTLLHALGNLPYVQVHQLVQKIQTQAGQQLDKLQNGSENEQDKEELAQK